MRVLVINYEYPPIGGGAANASQHYCQELSKNNEVTVITGSYKDLPRIQIEKNLKIIRVKSLRAKQGQSNVIEMLSFIFAACIKLAELLKSEKFDTLLIFFASPFGLLGLLAKYFFKTKFSVFIRGGDIPGFVASTDFYHFLLAPLTRLILKEAKYIFSNGKHLQSLTRKFLSESWSKELQDKEVISISNGAVIPESEHQVRDKDLLFVGRLVQEQKNIFVLVEILKQIPEIQMTIVGEGPDEQELKNKLELASLDNRVNFLGWLNKEELIKCYQTHKVLLIPSFYEGVSNVLLEAIVNKIFIVASAIPDNIEQLENYPKAKLVDEYLAEDYAETVASVFAHTDLLKQEIPDALLKNYSWTDKAQNLEDYLKKN